MSKYSIDSTTLTNIANAIRAKDGTSSPIVVSDFATRINAIPTSGVNFASPYDIYINYTTDMIKFIDYSNYQSIAKVAIPYDIWKDYTNIDFDWFINNSATRDTPGCLANLRCGMGRIVENYIWDPDQVSIYITSPYTYFFQDLQGAYSSLGQGTTISTQSLSPTENYKDLIIDLQVKGVNSTDDFNTIRFGLGSIRGRNE